METRLTIRFLLEGPPPAALSRLEDGAQLAWHDRPALGQARSRPLRGSDDMKFTRVRTRRMTKS